MLDAATPAMKPDKEEAICLPILNLYSPAGGATKSLFGVVISKF